MSLVYSQVTFRYGHRRPPVVDGFDWAVNPGRTVLLGPNGSGKTTLLAIAADALNPERGSVSAHGLESRGRAARMAYRRAVAWMPQHTSAVSGLTAQEQVAYAGWLKGLSHSDAWNAATRVLTLVDLADQTSRLASELSGGQLRRVGLAQALVHDAAVVLLDEPTAGLDPAQRATFRAIVASLPSDRVVLISTHQVDDLSDLFDRVAVLIDGTVRHESTVDEFLALAPPGAARPAEVAYARFASGRD